MINPAFLSGYPARLPRLARALIVALALLAIPTPALSQAGGEENGIGEATETPLDVRTKPFSPFAFQQSGKWVGFSLDLWAAIADDLGKDFRISGEASVSDLLGTVESGKADVAVAGITITSEREGKVDFTHAFYESGLQVLTRKEEGRSNVWAVIQSSGLLDILTVLLLTLLLIAHLVWIAERMKGTEEFAPTYPRGVWDAFWWAAVTVTTVGYGDKVPKSDMGRVLALFWMFSGLILVSFFTASVTTALTLERLDSEITGPGDLKKKRVGAPAGSTSAGAVRTYGGVLVELQSLEEGIGLLRDGQVDALVYDAPVLQYHVRMHPEDPFVLAGPVFQREAYGIALPEGSTLREPINTALLHLRESGVYQSLHEKWFGGGM